LDCYRCHTPIPDTSRFCLSCGADVSDPSGGGATTAAMDEAASEQVLRLVRQEVGSEFEVERELGRGGMAIVYLATEVHLRRKVAIKVLPPELTFGAGAVERFKREAQTAATLDHPHIIPIYRIAPGGRLFWYAMKFLEGLSLADFLKEKARLSLDEAIAVLQPVASALDYAHRRGVIHRDVKPANIMLDDDLRVTVTDFGIAKQLAAGSFTASGSVIGTPYYMSPEQCTGSKTLTGAADQYSLGVMAYQMLAGQLPFEGDSAIDILTKHCMLPPPPLDVLRPGLPPQVYLAVEQALAKKAEARFPTVAAFVEALTHAPSQPSLQIDRGPSATWQRISTAVMVPVRPRRRLLWGAATLVVLGGGATGLWLTQQAPSPSSLGPAAEVEPPAVTLETARAEDAVRDPGTPAAVAAPADTPPVRPAVVTGRVVVTGLPSGATVRVDGRLRDGTEFELQPGRHTVRMDAEGYEPASTDVMVAAGGWVQLPFVGRPLAAGPAAPADDATPLREATPVPTQGGVLVVRTVGGWGRIYVDGALGREGSSHRDSLPAGSHVIRVERPGYATVDTTVSLGPGETKIVTIQMREGAP